MCVLTHGECCESDVRTASVRIDRGDEVRVRALTAPEAVLGVRDLSLRSHPSHRLVRFHRLGPKLEIIRSWSVGLQVDYKYARLVS